MQAPQHMENEICHMEKEMQAIPRACHSKHAEVVRLKSLFIPIEKVAI